MRPDELPQVLARAFTVFRSERPGPVHIEIPLDVITADADHLDTAPFPLPSSPGPAPEVTAQAAQLLSRAKRPLIALGGGSISASSKVIALAERLGAPVVNTVNAKGVIPCSHPLAVGGSGSIDGIRTEFEQADVVLAVGTEFGETDYDFFFSGPVNIGGKLIRVDIDAHQLTRNVRADIAIQSDARLALRAILAELPTECAAQDAGETRAAAIRTSLCAGRDSRYQAFFEALRQALPDVIIAGDSTQPTYYAWLHYETEKPRRYFHSASGLPAAIGAKLARPDLPVVALIGDGASQFTIGELASAAEIGLPVIFLIWNNSGYGEIKRFMEQGNITPIGVDIFTPDFLALGQALGCHVTSITSLEALQTELASADRRSGPTLIEVTQDDFADGYPMP
jgi:acetolactate synthase-1/2/3 large subunit